MIYKNTNNIYYNSILATWNHKRFIIYIAAGISAAVLLLVFLWIICIATAYDKKWVTNQFAWYSGMNIWRC